MPLLANLMLHGTQLQTIANCIIQHLKCAEHLLHAQDPSLPKGHAIWIATKDMPAGLYYVTDDREDADGWADAMHLAVHLMSRQQLTALGSVLQPDTATSRRTTATQ